MFPSYMHDGK